MIKNEFKNYEKHQLEIDLSSFEYEFLFEDTNRFYNQNSYIFKNSILNNEYNPLNYEKSKESIKKNPLSYLNKKREIEIQEDSDIFKIPRNKFKKPFVYPQEGNFNGNKKIMICNTQEGIEKGLNNNNLKDLSINKANVLSEESKITNQKKKIIQELESSQKKTKEKIILIENQGKNI